MAAADLKFLVEPDEALKCNICLEIAKDPKQEEGCGKLFCSACIEDWKKKSSPTCRTGKPRYFKDKKSHREIQAIGVKCNNVKNGCDWEGTIATLQDHVAECDFILVPCPNGCTVHDDESLSDYEEDGDQEVFYLLKSNVDEHLLTQCPERQYQCPDCGLTDKYRIIVRPHEEECAKKIVCCPNEDCEAFLERELIQDHLENFCVYTKLACTYAKFGCTEKIMRKDMEKHEKDVEYHFPIVLDKISHLNDFIEHRLPFAAANDQRQVTFKLEEYSDKKKSGLAFDFEPLLTSPTGYKMCLSVYANGNGSGKRSHVSAYIKLLHGPYDGRLKWPFSGTVTIELLNQDKNCDHHKASIHYDEDDVHSYAGGGGYGKAKFIRRDDLTGDVEYLKDDTLFFRVTVKQNDYKHWLETY